MREQHIRTPPGTFAKCPCGQEPRHIMVFGTRASEQLGKKYPLGITERHKLHCRCGRTTAKHGSLQSAVADWGPILSQIPLVLPATVVTMPRRGPRRVVSKDARRG